MYRRIMVPVCFVLLATFSRGFAADTETAADEQTLKGANLKVEGPVLLDYLKKQTKPAKAAPDGVALAALRQVARLKPAGSAEIILGYLPNVPSEAAAEEARNTLARVALPEGKLDKAVVAALTSTAPESRAAAAEIVARRGGLAHLADVRKLLKDNDNTVRLRAAIALGEMRDPEAVPVLVNLVGELPTEQASLADSMLRDVAGALVPNVEFGTDAAAHKKAREGWEAWWKGIDDKAMLERLKNATLTEVLREKVQKYVKQLSDDDFDVREKASAGLVEAGSAAVPLLLQASKDSDAEVARRAEACLSQIDKEPGKSNPATTCRVIAARRPAGAVDVLLAYRPFAHDESSAEEIQAALNAVAYRDGKPEKALLDALNDKVAVRRAAAAAALAQQESGLQLAEVRKCLTDKDPVIRMTVALAMARMRDREAVTALVDGLAEASAEQIAGAEDLLIRLSSGQPAASTPGADKESRTKFRDAWAAWLKTQNPLDMTRLDDAPRQLGYTLVVIPGNGRVLEIDRNGKTRWELNGLQYPFDAQVLPNGNVLVAEFHGRKVTERTPANKVVWEKAVTWPIGCQRLANGNTFIATRNQLLEVNREGKELTTINRPQHDILAAVKTRNGEFACVLNTQRFVRLDNTGKELKSFGIGAVHNYVQFDMLPNGNVLIPQQGNNKVVEFDPSGKSVWEVTTNFPFASQRLSNGRTLVTSINMNQVYELDRSGKQVWQANLPGPSWRARRR